VHGDTGHVCCCLKCAQDLKAKGFASQISEDAKARLFRVKAGPVADRAAAQALQARLVAAGYRATLSAP
jgi:cell division septation protein DedD